ncbi:hypothetical protein J3459_003951 [Metarhizium acridum]|nr:hypothetical protein J3459_003951 [Metarhizium acridum]
MFYLVLCVAIDDGSLLGKAGTKASSLHDKAALQTGMNGGNDPPRIMQRESQHESCAQYGHIGFNHGTNSELCCPEIVVRELVPVGIAMPVSELFCPVSRC